MDLIKGRKSFTPLAIRALSLESIVAKMPTSQRGGQGKLELMKLEHPATTLKRASKSRKGPYQKRPSGPKPVKIRGEQEDQ